MGGQGMGLLMLAAMFALAASQHMMALVRSPEKVEHLWRALAAMAAAGAATIQGYHVDGEPIPLLLAEWLPASVVSMWLFGIARISVQGDHLDPTKRRLADIAVTLVAAAFIGNLAANDLADATDSAWLTSLCRVLDWAAMALIAWCLLERARHAWSVHLRLRAMVVSGIFLALCLFAGQMPPLGQAGPMLPPMALCILLVVELLMMWDLAGRSTDVVSHLQKQELANASRLSIVGELTATVAHEINQPLGAILSNADAAELLLDYPAPPLDEIRQIIADIRRDGLRASDVIRHVRKLVRKRELDLDKLDANDLARNVVTLLEPESRARRVIVAHALWPQPLHVLADRALIDQALINLVMNALDAVEAVGAVVETGASSVVVGVRPTTHGDIELKVVDDGVGIPKERLAHLFDSFYTSKAHGMGLGLSISRSIIEAHGGRICVENNPLAGATFSITLPAHSVAEAAA